MLPCLAWLRWVAGDLTLKCFIADMLTSAGVWSPPLSGVADGALLLISQLSFVRAVDIGATGILVSARDRTVIFLTCGS